MEDVSLLRRILCYAIGYPIGFAIMGSVISRQIFNSFVRPMSQPWEDDPTYPVAIFGWSNESCVFAGSLPTLAVERGRTNYVPILVIYVWRDDEHNHPKQVTVRMTAGNSCYPVNREAISHLSEKELLKIEGECLQNGKYDKNLFFNTGSWLSFEPEQFELYDRQIKMVLMKIDVPANLPKEYDKGLTVTPLPRVVKPSSGEIGGGASGINVWIVD